MAESCARAAVVEGTPQITQFQVWREVRRYGWASPRIQAQPAGETLVQLPTYLYGKLEGPVRHDFEILGQRVQVEMSPDYYTWTIKAPEDTEVMKTESLGGPYPDGDVTYTFEEKGHASIASSVTYTGRYKVNDQPWEQFDEVLSLDGSTVELDVLARTPNLSGH